MIFRLFSPIRCKSISKESGIKAMDRSKNSTDLNKNQKFSRNQCQKS